MASKKPENTAKKKQISEKNKNKIKKKRGKKQKVQVKVTDSGQVKCGDTINKLKDNKGKTKKSKSSPSSPSTKKSESSPSPSGTRKKKRGKNQKIQVKVTDSGNHEENEIQVQVTDRDAHDESFDFQLKYGDTINTLKDKLADKFESVESEQIEILLNDNEVDGSTTFNNPIFSDPERFNDLFFARNKRVKESSKRLEGSSCFELKTNAEKGTNCVTIYPGAEPIQHMENSNLAPGSIAEERPTRTNELNPGHLPTASVQGNKLPGANLEEKSKKKNHAKKATNVGLTRPNLSSADIGSNNDKVGSSNKKEKNACGKKKGQLKRKKEKMQINKGGGSELKNNMEEPIRDKKSRGKTEKDNSLRKPKGLMQQKVVCVLLAVLVIFLAIGYNIYTSIRSLPNEGLLLVSSNPNNLLPSAPWYALAGKPNSLVYEESDGNVYDFLTQKQICTSCVEEVQQLVSSNGIIWVEDFKFRSSILRNLITTVRDKDEYIEQRYKFAVGENDDNNIEDMNIDHDNIRFIVVRLSCESLSEYLKNSEDIRMTDDDIKVCGTDSKSREAWFSVFAYFYGVIRGGLSNHTCFMDDNEIYTKKRKKNTVDLEGNFACVRATSYNIAIKNHGIKATSLSPDERQLYKSKIKHALERSPSDAYKSRCVGFYFSFVVYDWFSFLPHNPDCWKRAYIASHYSHFHLGLLGIHGVGKSTYLKNLQVYASIEGGNLHSDFASVCPPGSGSCTLRYSRERYSTTHYFYDTRGLESIDTGYVKGVSDLVNGRSTTIEIEKPPGFTTNVSSRLRSFLRSFVFLIYGFIKYMVYISFFCCLLFLLSIAVRINSVEKRASIVVCIVLFLAVLFILYFPYPVAPPKRTEQERRELSLDAFAFVTFMPSINEEYKSLNFFLKKLDKVLRSELSPYFIVAVTNYETCTKLSVSLCRKDFENKLKYKTNHAFMLDKTEPTFKDADIKKIMDSKVILLEPDRVFRLLVKLQNCAFTRYRDIADAKYNSRISWSTYCFEVLESVIVYVICCCCIFGLFMYVDGSYNRWSIYVPRQLQRRIQQARRRT